MLLWESATQEVLADSKYQSRYESANLRAAFMPHEQYGAFINAFANDTESFLKDAGVIE
jgi:tripartite-type tricarboxylate transporter receptor subunit TctC